METTTTSSTSRGFLGGGQQTDLALRVLRGIQFVFALVVLGTVAAVVSANSEFTGCYNLDFTYFCFYTPRSFNYTIFASVWTILVSIYFFVSIFVPKIYLSISALVLDAVGVIIWFASFVALAVWLGAADAYYGLAYTTDKGRGLLTAATIFGAFLFLSYIATLVISYTAYRRSGGARHFGGATPMQTQAPPADKAQQGYPQQQQQGYPPQQQQQPYQQPMYAQQVSEPPQQPGHTQQPYQQGYAQQPSSPPQNYPQQPASPPPPQQQQPPHYPPA